MAVHFAEHCREDWGWLRSVITKPAHLCWDLKKKSMSCKLSYVHLFLMLILSGRAHPECGNSVNGYQFGSPAGENIFCQSQSGTLPSHKIWYSTNINVYGVHTAVNPACEMCF